MPTTLPYGTWPSPLSAAELAAGNVRPGDLHASGDALLWTEARPSEGGRQALVRWDGERVTDLTPGDFNTRTRVHEYGGASFVAVGDGVLASRWDDQRLHDVTSGEPRPVTPEPDQPAAVRWADGDADPDGTRVVLVRETHRAGAEAVNEIVALDPASGEVHVLVTGRDFVASPRLSPDGRRLAWLAWDHPHMPWDAAELWVADLAGDGLAEPRRIAGGDGTSACSVVWLPDGRLAFSDDRTGFWEVHVHDGGTVTRVSSFGADCGAPAWQFGERSFAPLPDGRLVCNVTGQGTQRLVVLDPTDGSEEPTPLPTGRIDQVVPFGDGVAVLATGVDGTTVIAVWEPGGDVVEAARYDLPVITAADRAAPELVEVTTPDGDTTHAFLWLPAHRDVRGPEGARPPLLVRTHGGPTGHVAPTLTADIAYWTTRGIAVADVNYRGSSGFGRAYRDALQGRWGELDVEDTIAVARTLADEGRVDGGAMAIRGGSAGGYTTLAVLTTPGHPYACGTSLFGVADLELLAVHTHKFESRYLDGLVGPLPEARDVYRARSPLYRADQLSRPILLLQGLEDQVVSPEQAEAMVAAASEAGIPHAYIAYEGEQHGFRRAENIVNAFESELAFYGLVMGFEPAGDLPPVELVTA